MIKFFKCRSNAKVTHSRSHDQKFLYRQKGPDVTRRNTHAKSKSNAIHVHGFLTDRLIDRQTNEI